MSLFDKNKAATADEPVVDMTELWDAIAVLEGSEPGHKLKAVPASVLSPISEQVKKEEEKVAAAAAAAIAASDQAAEAAGVMKDIDKALKATASDIADCNWASADSHLRTVYELADRFSPEKRKGAEDGLIKIFNTAVKGAKKDLENNYPASLAKDLLDVAYDIAGHISPERKGDIDGGFMKVFNTAVSLVESDVMGGYLAHAKSKLRTVYEIADHLSPGKRGAVEDSLMEVVKAADKTAKKYLPLASSYPSLAKKPSLLGDEVKSKIAVLQAGQALAP